MPSVFNKNHCKKKTNNTKYIGYRIYKCVSNFFSLDAVMLYYKKVMENIRHILLHSRIRQKMDVV